VRQSLSPSPGQRAAGCLARSPGRGPGPGPSACRSRAVRTWSRTPRRGQPSATGPRPATERGGCLVLLRILERTPTHGRPRVGGGRSEIGACRPRLTTMGPNGARLGPASERNPETTYQPTCFLLSKRLSGGRSNGVGEPKTVGGSEGAPNSKRRANPKTGQFDPRPDSLTKRVTHQGEGFCVQ